MTAKSDVVVKLALVFFISLLSFSIGTFVGKKYSDNQHKLASLEPSAHGEGAREVASIGEEPAKADGAIRDDEIAKIASEFADDESQATKPESATAEKAGEKEKAVTEKGGEKAEVAGEKTEKTEKTEKPAVAVAEKAKPVTEEPSGPAKNVAAGKVPTTEKIAEKKENRQPSSLPKDVASYAVGKFTVQIASYLTEGEAHDRADALKKQGFSAFYVPATVKGTMRFRVNVGLFASEGEAKNYRSELMSKAKVDNAIVQKIMN